MNLNKINKILITIPSLVIMLVCGLYLFTDIINKDSDISIGNTITYKNLTSDNIDNSNLYIYGYQGDILTSRGAAFSDGSNNIITVRHNVDKSDNTYYIYKGTKKVEEVKKAEMIGFEKIYLSGNLDLAIIETKNYIDIIGSKLSTNINNSGYIYLSGQATPGQSGSPVYCDDDQYICGIIVANNETTKSVKILLINQNMVNDIKTIGKSN